MSETRKLYYEDVYHEGIYCKGSRVQRELTEDYEIVLDQTAFYPEGGGQPCDLGTLNGIAVDGCTGKGIVRLFIIQRRPLEAGSEGNWKDRLGEKI